MKSTRPKSRSVRPSNQDRTSGSTSISYRSTMHPTVYVSDAIGKLGGRPPATPRTPVSGGAMSRHHRAGHRLGIRLRAGGWTSGPDAEACGHVEFDFAVRE